MSLIQLSMDALDPTIKCEVDFFQQFIRGTDTTTGHSAAWYIRFPYYPDKWAAYIKQYMDNERAKNESQTGDGSFV